MLDEKVKLIAACHVSNLLGGILDLSELTKRAHAVGARTVVDGVAYAPHLPLKFDAWDVDFYVYSNYKVYGPHQAALIGKREAWAQLKGPNHFFMADDYFPGKFEPGGVSHEACAGILGSLDYLEWLGGLEATFAHELELAHRLLAYLKTRPDFQVLGYRNNRVATISWISRDIAPRELVAKTDAADVAIRWGHMYSYRLLAARGLDPEVGVVRASFVHYNTLQEVDRLISALDS